MYADDHGPDAALTAGGRCAEIDEAADPVGVLIVADGLHTSHRLRPAATTRLDPGPGRPRRRVGGRRRRALTRLPRAVVGRVAYQVLAGLEPARGRRRSSIAGRPTASGISPASGIHEAARDHRPDRHREVGAGAGGGGAAGRRDRERRRHAALPRHGHRNREAAPAERRGIPTTSSTCWTSPRPRPSRATSRKPPPMSSGSRRPGRCRSSSADR